MTVIYANTVRSVGPEAASFLAERMLVTFGDQAPEELRDFCYALPPATSTGAISVGDALVLDGARYPITAIGDVAQKNLDALGHVTLVFDGAAEPRLSGAIHVSAQAALPTLRQGSTIAVESA
ncbi:MAG: PTS glucitol/sorbitol transporter subunit IIA [Acidipropionibacterium acidipropionici]|jgi:PTS system glucitol/sorbitol-specific IIA component|uniref:PTS sorbitol transporter subunit IIA n=2 Tax=Acidipropionibacterium acidipropionici TaxID=1748 RepID=A0A142KFC1_9ACTN|nr:PTS glucitol/sorbitol transporter subunit IIA [Acidipropionibacterium acidipropionici]AFV89964.1 PTS system, glucitol/sorbitol-specific, IIA component [Acidipropionibacterium acidipropionici ATCC 4875]ALN15705.1 PTS sorbitol transporter subunit IIA [Acidipropionibacterium acidipropionici]AMS04809.1 PTS sorbitol transporter subunit IIA [Acidipropionibacterium acidipropionici]AOZ46296.1 PTS sorbitol transporter subunit IIA [Acidipropionibacterium acidipropionici]APZ08550.1 PTS sorbitol transp